ncbi:MAG TPA: hypothetical protein VGR28_02345 [Candidatus Thermoplasmatota archaeon]|jgi:hypothetical protein|nr:hypothetical protein [Candidatus Thermoplasmatota archaeon]
MDSTSRQEAFVQRLRGRGVQERFAHLAYYEGEPPGQSLRVGIELSEAAERTRRRGA